MSIVIRARKLRVRERQAHDLVVVVISLCSSVIRGLRLPWLESREVGCIGFSQLALPNARTWNPTARPRREKFVDPGRTASISIRDATARKKDDCRGCARRAHRMQRDSFICLGRLARRNFD